MRLLLVFHLLLLMIGRSDGQYLRRRLQEDAKTWRERVKSKGEVTWQEKKRAAIRAACYKDWKPGCRRIVEWAKKTGRIQGAEQQELVDFARKVLAAAEKDQDIYSSDSGSGTEGSAAASPASSESEAMMSMDLEASE